MKERTPTIKEALALIIIVTSIVSLGFSTGTKTDLALRKETQTKENDQPKEQNKITGNMIKATGMPTAPMSEQEFRNRMLNAIKYQETGRGGTGLTDAREWIARAFGSASTIGPYEVSKVYARKIVRERMTSQERQSAFGTNSPQDSQIDSYIETETGGRDLASRMVNSNVRVMEAYHRTAGLEPPKIGSERRAIYDGSAYNNGADRPIAAGIQYSLLKIGVNIPNFITKDDTGNQYSSPIDGYLYDSGSDRSRTGEAFREWYRTEYTGNIHLTNQQIDNAFKGGVAGVVNSNVWNVVNEEHKRQYSEPATLLVPTDYIAKPSSEAQINGRNVLYKLENYGYRTSFGTRGTYEGQHEMPPDQRTYTSYSPTQSNSVKILTEIDSGASGWRGVNVVHQFSPEFSNNLRNALRELRTSNPEAYNRLVVRDATRTNAEQARLFQQDPAHAAKPGTSEHEHGNAIDINWNYLSPEQRIAVTEAFARNGIVNTQPGEAWHFAAKPASAQEHYDLLVSQGRVADDSVILGQIAQVHGMTHARAVRTSSGATPNPTIPPSQTQHPACFLPSTPITLSDGSTKNIEDIEKGDVVLSYDFETQEQVASEVVTVFSHLDQDYIIVNEKVKVTPYHEVYAKKAET